MTEVPGSHTRHPGRPVQALRDSYEALASVVAPLGDEESWRPPANRDAVTYWQDWRPSPVGAANGRRWSRVGASMFLDFRQLRALYLETATATVVAAAATDPDLPVSTQGRVLTAADLMTTLAVEASIHHLDLVRELPTAPGPSASGLTAVRTTLDGHYARAATGRTPLAGAERRSLGADADRLPLFS